MKLIYRIVVLTCLMALASTLYAQQKCSGVVLETTGGLASGVFSDNFDGTVTHNSTGLIWKRCTEGQAWDSANNTCVGTQNPVSWTNALTTARNATYANKNDWRLPNVKELESVVEHKCTDPAINKEVFPTTPTTVYWASSSYAGNPSFAWGVYFFSGETKIIEKQTLYSIRLVRDGGSNPAGNYGAFDSLGTTSTAAPSCTLNASPTSVAAGDASLLTPVCTPAATSYIWTGGTCAGSTGASCTVRPTASTTYTVAGVNAGGTGAASIGVTVAVSTPLPTCTLSAAPSSISSGATATLTAACSPAVSAYAWTGGTCAGTTGLTCVVTPTTQTIYSVVGTNVTGPSTAAYVTVNVTAPTAPSCSLSASPASITSGGTSVLTPNCSPAATSFVWTGGTCAGTTGATCSVTPTTTTIYSVAGVNQVGTGTAANATVTVTPSAPICTLSASPASIASGDTSVLTPTCSPAATSYVWTGGTCAGSAAATCTIRPTTTTAYTVAGVNAGGTGAASVGATVTVTTPVPSCTLSASPATIVTGGTSTLTSTCTPAATSFVWTGGTCATNTTATCTVTPTASTSYTVAGLNVTGTGAASGVATVTVSATPVCSLVAMPTAVKSGGASTLTANCSPAATSYFWTGGACGANQGASCVVNPTGTTAYTVAGVTSQGLVGTAATATVTIPIASAPVCTLSASPVVISSGGTATLTATCSPEATAYTWSVNAGFTATAKSGTVSPTKPTMYTLIGSNAAGETGTQATAAVYVCNTSPSDIYPGLVVMGTSANEQVVQGIGSDTIDGGPGFDTVIYNCNKDSFTIARTTAGWSISSTAEGIDALANVERLRFSDKTLALDISGNAGQAYRLYRASFDRVPDNAGLKFWINALDNGASLKEAAAGFMASDEFKALYGANPTNEIFVTKIYTNILHRVPDLAGYNYWVNALNQKIVTQMDVLMLLSESPENQSGVIGSILNGIELLN